MASKKKEVRKKVEKAKDYVRKLRDKLKKRLEESEGGVLKITRRF